MKGIIARVWALGLVVLLLPIAAAYGQAGLPIENHYKVYTAQPETTIVHPVVLSDQFGIITVQDVRLDRVANPTTKYHNGVQYPIVDPLAHQTWWRLFHTVPTPERTVIGIDQFSYGPVRLGNPVYLLNPALKNALPPYGGLPLRNHYLCYEVIGSLPLMKTVLLYDQWGQCDVIVVRAKLFCNPVEKRDLVDGKIYPIIDPRAHLQCYFVDNPMTDLHQARYVDQFGEFPVYAYRNDCLCTPALKEHVNSTEESTWGRIKALYQ